MRKGLFAVIALMIILNLWTGCDNGEVLLDDEKTVLTDSTLLNLMSDKADTAHLVVRKLVNADKWNASLEGGTDWCSLSKTSGGLGDTIFVYAKENFTSTIRSTFVRIEAGTLIERYWVRQSGKKE